MYVAIGVNLQGKKELWGLWLSETEDTKFWLSCLTDLKNRGGNDLFIVCVDGLSGFPEALRTALPPTQVQLGLVHLVRAALKYTTDKGSRAAARAGGGGGREDDLPSGDGAGSGAGVGGLCAERGGERSDDREAMAAEVDGHYRDVRVPCADPQSDLHDERDRVGEQRDLQVDAQPQAVPECGVRVEVGVPGDPRGIEEVADAHRGLEGRVEPRRHRG